MKRDSDEFRDHLKRIGLKKGYDKRRKNNEAGRFKKGHKTNIGKKSWNAGKKCPKISEGIKKHYAKGNRPWNWKGLSNLNKRIRALSEYKVWRSKVFQRDNWTCQTCITRGCFLEAHHINELVKIIRDSKIRTLEQARKCKEIWDIENGVTLCKACHNLTKRGYSKALQ